MDIRQVALLRGRDGEFIGTAMGWRAKTVTDWVIQGLARNCPLADRCTSTSEPFVWDCDANSATWCGCRLSEEQQAVLSHYNQDVCGGVTVPVRRADRTGYVSWCSRDRDRLGASYEASLSSIYLLSHTFMRQLDRIHNARRERGTAKNVLTPREAECLTWVARGRTTEEIAALLQRSADTVEFHVSNAVLKLNARNRAHAVAIACTRGMIREL